MKKTYKLVDLDCANCARKMQDAISRLDGVTSVRVNFLTQEMTLEADDRVFPALLKEAARIFASVEPDSRLIH